LPRAKQDQALVAISDRIATAANVNAVASAFKIVDDFAPQLEAFVKGKPEPVGVVEHRVLARQEGEQITFLSAGGTLETITAADLHKLDSNSQKLIRAYERTMKELFERWLELKPKRVSRDPDIKREAQEESDDVRRDLCQQLNEILDFLTSIGKHLHDHYDHVRHICRQK
jgi:hypothetical protein